jgi:urea transport system substrate-binding protein
LTAIRAASFLLAATGLALLVTLQLPERHPPIRVGVLHSLTGTMASSERPVVDATLLAIEEINQAGGLLGRDVEAVVVDGRSEPDVFAAEAERLVAADRVKAIFGCWTSASRKTVKAVVERHRHLLFYPVQYEGLEQSPFIVYTGAAPNQQVNIAIHFAFTSFGSRFFLVGSDYVFPRAANAIIRDLVEAQGGGVIAGEDYVPLGGKDFSAAVAAIVRTRPDVIINTVNGDSNRAFFHALRAAGITSQEVPTISLSIDENLVREIGPADLAGDYVVSNYFQSLDTRANRRFVERFRARFGSDRPTSDAMQAAYSGVLLWAQAVAETRSVDVAMVRDTLGDQSVDAPGGVMYIDHETRHTWKSVHVAEIRADGLLEIVWSSDYPVQPVPFPPSRSQASWEGLLADLSRRWDGRWAARGAGA